MSRPLVVTGATGWIGRALLARLEREGALDRVRLFGSRDGSLEVGGEVLPIRPLATITGTDVANADVVHLAYLTREKAELLGEPAYVAANREIDAALLAACADARPHALFVASSGAARDEAHPYGRLKREQEQAFLRFGAVADVPVLAARIFALAGPYMNKLESYAVGDLLRQALRHPGLEPGSRCLDRAEGSGTPAQGRGDGDRRIRVSAAQPVFRSYLHVDDLARIALGALEQGIGFAAPIDFCGSEVVEMGEIARAVAMLAGLPESAVERPPLGFDSPSAYLGDPVALRTLALRLGVPLRPFAEQLRDTAAWLTEARFR